MLAAIILLGQSIPRYLESATIVTIQMSKHLDTLGDC